MVPKKSSKADLEDKKSLFFEIGLALSMLLVLVAFEWKSTRNIDLKDVKAPKITDFIEEIPITEPDEIKTPPSPNEVFYSDKINVIDNNLTPKQSPENIFTGEDINGLPPVISARAEEEVEEAVIIVQVMPKFGEGGLDEFRNEFVMKNLRYPEEAQENRISGCVYIEFVVEKDGSLSNFKSIRKADESLISEAIRVIKKSPKWTPGKHNGKLVRVKFTLPINFVLNEL